MIYNKKSQLTRLPVLAVFLLLLGACGEQRFQPLDAPDFTLDTLEGGTSITLSDYRGQVVYLSFWASWCTPCRQEMPFLAKLSERHAGEGFQVLAVNVDEQAQAARDFVAQYELPFPILRDSDKTVSKQYRIPGFPTHYIVDRTGRIRFSGLGFNLADVEAVSQEVATLLAESAGSAD